MVFPLRSETFLMLFLATMPSPPAVRSYDQILVGGQWRDPAGGARIEVVSPPLQYTDESFTEVRKVCAALGRLGANINQTCGMHVHVNAGDMTPAQARAISRSTEFRLPMLLR